MKITKDGYTIIYLCFLFLACLVEENIYAYLSKNNQRKDYNSITITCHSKNCKIISIIIILL